MFVVYFFSVIKTSCWSAFCFLDSVEQGRLGIVPANRQGPARLSEQERGLFHCAPPIIRFRRSAASNIGAFLFFDSDWLAWFLVFNALHKVGEPLHENVHKSTIGSTVYVIGLWEYCLVLLRGLLWTSGLWICVHCVCACLWYNSPLRLCGKKGARGRAVKTQLGGCVAGGHRRTPPATAVGQAGAITLRSRARSKHDQCALFFVSPLWFLLYNKAFIVRGSKGHGRVQFGHQGRNEPTIAAQVFDHFILTCSAFQQCLEPPCLRLSKFQSCGATC